MACPIGVPLWRELDLRALDLPRDAVFDAPRLALEERELLRADARPPFEPRVAEEVDRPPLLVLFFDDLLRVRVGLMSCLVGVCANDGAVAPRLVNANSMPCARRAPKPHRLLRRATDVAPPHARAPRGSRVIITGRGSNCSTALLMRVDARVHASWCTRQNALGTDAANRFDASSSTPPHRKTIQ